MREVRWLLFIMLFDVTGGDLLPKLRMTAVYETERQCNAMGEELARRLSYDDNSLRSFSICIPESAYDAEGIQTQRLD